MRKSLLLTLLLLAMLLAPCARAQEAEEATGDGEEHFEDIMADDERPPLDLTKLDLPMDREAIKR